MESTQKRLVKNLIGEIIRFLDLFNEKDEVKRILSIMSTFFQGEAIYTPQSPNIPPKEESLLEALNLIRDETIKPIKIV